MSLKILSFFRTALAVLTVSIVTETLMLTGGYSLPMWARAFLAGALALLLIYGTKKMGEIRRQFEYYEEELRFKDAVYQMVIASAETDDRIALYHLILRMAIRAIGNAEKGTILKLDEVGFFRFEAAEGYDLQGLKQIRLHPEETLEHIKTEGRFHRPVIINDFKTVNRENLEPDKLSVLSEATADIQSILTAPIHLDGRLWGNINIDSTVAGAFDSVSAERLGVFVSETIRVIKQYDAQEQTAYLATRDPLTGLLNRRAFKERFMELLKTAQEAEAGALVSIDLDGFKAVNDRFGHMAGDQVLIRFATVLAAAAGEEALVCRYGGDEFAVVFHGMGTTVAVKAMEAASEQLARESLYYQRNLLPIRFSYGIATYGGEDRDYSHMMNQVDARLYAVKNSRRKTE